MENPGKYAKYRDDKKCPECDTPTKEAGKYGAKMYWCERCDVKWERTQFYLWKQIDERTMKQRRIDKLKEELAKLEAAK